MKTTLTTRSTANPRRTTLAHLTDAEELRHTAAPAYPSDGLPPYTANPRRTTLIDAPAG